MAASSDFFVVRRFDRLHTRIILTLQAQASELERRLDNLDKRLSNRNARLRTMGVEASEYVDLRTVETTYGNDELEEINNGSVRYDIVERAELVAAITSKIAEYGMSLPTNFDLS